MFNIQYAAWPIFLPRFVCVWYSEVTKGFHFPYCTFSNSFKIQIGTIFYLPNQKKFPFSRSGWKINNKNLHTIRKKIILSFYKIHYTTYIFSMTRKIIHLQNPCFWRPSTGDLKGLCLGMNNVPNICGGLMGVMVYLITVTPDRSRNNST